MIFGNCVSFGRRATLAVLLFLVFLFGLVTLLSTALGTLALFVSLVHLLLPFYGLKLKEFVFLELLIVSLQIIDLLVVVFFCALLSDVFVKGQDKVDQ